MIIKHYTPSLPDIGLPSLFQSNADLLFIDIETTGFSPKTSRLYMIGCLYFEAGEPRICQWIGEADEPAQEAGILKAFGEFCKPSHQLITFNGSTFDLPYLMQKYQRFSIPLPFDSLNHVDLLKEVRPFKTLLGLPDLKQKSLEAFLGLYREDTYSGGKLIPVFKSYAKSNDQDLLELLTLHNYEDVLGLVKLLPILNYGDLFEGGFDLDTIHKTPEAILADLQLKAMVPMPIDLSLDNGVRLTAQSAFARLTLPVFHGTLKYFYPNFKDYYYLPIEDQAIHKSVAAYVDKAHRVPAKPETCYIKREGDFLWQPRPFIEPVFKTEAKSPDYYLSLDQLPDHPLSYLQKITSAFLG